MATQPRTIKDMARAVGIHYCITQYGRVCLEPDPGVKRLANPVQRLHVAVLHH